MASSNMIIKQVRGPSSRSKAACRQCRDRHVKCDQLNPCKACQRLGLDCEYGTKPIFNPLEWQPKERADQVEVSLLTFNKNVSHAFVDETSNVADQYHVISHDTYNIPLDGLPSDSPSNSSLPVLTTISNAHDAISPQSVSSHVSISLAPHPRTSLDSSVQPLLPNIPPAYAAGNPITNGSDSFFFGRYADIIGPWFDLFDGRDQHFSTIVPQLALGNRLLLLSCLAAASRQHALVTNHGRNDTLDYYNQAIRMLYERLGEQSEPDPATFASCLLIAHCEMVESQAGDWNLHLRGTRELIAMQGWNGISGGLGQACFWIFCRMIILACLSSSTPTPLPTSTWVPFSPPLSPLPSVTPEWMLPAWANKTVHLLGRIHNFLVSSRSTLSSDPSRSTLTVLATEWDNLHTRLDRHNQERPPICCPLSILPRSPTDDQPFSQVRYMNSSVAAARQMYHTAVLLLHLSTPALPDDKLSTLASPTVSKPALGAARKIVANSITNRGAVAWVNAVQLLTTAGACLLEWRERRACMAVLEDIQQVTGWKTEGNVNLLMRSWGWEGTEGGWKAVQGDIGPRQEVWDVLLKAWDGGENARQAGH